jgi:crotonobetainyl-CoA:carnitine CoA-transferase CaiB-like acyl-CoA transferase
LSDAAAPPGALDGVRVLSLGAFTAGHTATLLLAELGADTVQIESHAHPEVLRNPAYGYGEIYAEPSGLPQTPLHAGLTRSTRALALDMATPSGRDLFRRLVRVTDILIENFSPTLLERWECSFRYLVQLNPALVMLSLSGYGRTGPRAEFRAYATNIGNFSGLASIMGASNGTLTDYLAAEHSAVGALAALRAARSTGQGVWVDVAQIETAAAVMAPLYLETVGNGDESVPGPNEVAGSLLVGVYPAQGHDRWLAIELEDVDDWNVLAEFLELPELRIDAPDEADAHRAALDGAVAAWAAQHSPHAASHVLQQAGLAAGAVQDSEDIVRDPQLRTRQDVIEIDHPDLGPIEYPQSPDRLSRTPGRVKNPGPRLGQDTVEVLHDWLGLDDAEVDALLASGTAWTAPPA